MEKGNYTTGQLLGVKEKNGKLVREYVAGFFGEEPIIKQRLLTPQEARRYREDIARGKDEGKTESEAVREAGTEKPAGTPKRRLVRKKKVAGPGGKLVRKKRVKKGAGVENGDQVATPVRPAEAAPSAAQMEYVPEGSDSLQDYIQNLINSEPDKPDFNPANTQAAISSISKIGCPDMKIYRIGATEGENEGDFYTQKEYVARNLLGLPLWKPKPAITEEAEAKESESKELVASEPDAKEPESKEPEKAESETQDLSDETGESTPKPAEQPENSESPPAAEESPTEEKEEQEALATEQEA